MYGIFQRALLLLLLSKTPVDGGTIGLDARKIDVRSRRNIEAEEGGELVKRFV
jgi:hypothetical protein